MHRDNYEMTWADTGVIQLHMGIPMVAGSHLKLGSGKEGFSLFAASGLW